MAEAECALGKIDPPQLAWAAGFFDGEGTTMAAARADRPGYRRLEVSVPQRGPAGACPEVLYRFQAAALGLGTICGPGQGDMHVWRSNGFAEAQTVIALLWPWLGPVKRWQATIAMRLVRRQYDSGAYKPRGPRRRRPEHLTHAHAARVSPSIGEMTLAWAAGFLDGEGHFGLPRAFTRKDATYWRRIRVSTTQNGTPGCPPEVLLRMTRIFGGRIEKHGEPDDFRWATDGLERVQAVLQRVLPWLGTVKQEQARMAVEGFAAQTRLHGDSTHCARGHAYDHLYMSVSGPKRRCNACSRWLSRRARAGKGIQPRQFKNVARRYNS